MRYLRRLAATGYFEQKHTDCAWLNFKDEPACKTLETYNEVKEWLVTQGLVRIVVAKLTPEEEKKMHFKDVLDLWWLEITDKGRAAV